MSVLSPMTNKMILTFELNVTYSWVQFRTNCELTILYKKVFYIERWPDWSIPWLQPGRKTPSNLLHPDRNKVKEF